RRAAAVTRYEGCAAGRCSEGGAQRCRRSARGGLAQARRCRWTVGDQRLSEDVTRTTRCGRPKIGRLTNHKTEQREEINERPTGRGKDRQEPRRPLRSLQSVGAGA